jgi:hypothetical protein
MLNTHRLLSALAATIVLAGAPACATGGFYRYPQAGTRPVDNRAYRNGYQAGREQGEADARRGRRFGYERNGDYRSADRGYGGRGSRGEYRQFFRDGFAAGYNDGYRRYARDTDGYPSGPYVYGGGRDRPQVYRSPAADSGYRDGYDQGREDARDGHRFDPIRASRYRSGDRDYDNRYGSRDEYKRQYRDAFQRGYEQGYREARR